MIQWNSEDESSISLEESYDISCNSPETNSYNGAWRAYPSQMLSLVDLLEPFFGSSCVWLLYLDHNPNRSTPKRMSLDPPTYGGVPTRCQNLDAPLSWDDSRLWEILLWTWERPAIYLFASKTSPGHRSLRCMLWNPRQSDTCWKRMPCCHDAWSLDGACQHDNENRRILLNFRLFLSSSHLVSQLFSFC